MSINLLLNLQTATYCGRIREGLTYFFPKSFAAVSENLFLLEIITLIIFLPNEVYQYANFFSVSMHCLIETPCVLITFIKILENVFSEDLNDSLIRFQLKYLMNVYLFYISKGIILKKVMFHLSSMEVGYCNMFFQYPSITLDILKAFFLLIKFYQQLFSRAIKESFFSFQLKSLMGVFPFYIPMLLCGNNNLGKGNAPFEFYVQRLPIYSLICYIRRC